MPWLQVWNKFHSFQIKISRIAYQNELSHIYTESSGNFTKKNRGLKRLTLIENIASAQVLYNSGQGGVLSKQTDYVILD